MKEVALIKRNNNSKLKREDNIYGYLFVAPAVLGILFFIAYPLFVSFVGMFVDWSKYDNSVFQAQWNNFENFRQVFGSAFGKYFWESLYNTVFIMIGIPIGLVLSLLFAMLLNRDMKGIYVYRVLFYLPVVSSLVAVCIMWQKLLAPDGALNNLLAIFGIKGPAWLVEEATAKWSIIFLTVWKGLGSSILLYLAGLQGISKSYYEAAEVDGSNAFYTFIKITVPLIYPTTFYLIVTGIIGGMQCYVEPQLLYGSSRLDTKTVVGYIFGKFGDDYLGEASVISWFLAIIVFIVTAIQFAYNGRRESK